MSEKSKRTRKIKTAVVTGGHAYDVPNFHKLFRSLKGIDAYIQPMDDFASSPEEVRDSYDVVLFYIMLIEGPQDEGLPWYAGKPKAALEHLGEEEQGIVVLHHAILAYPQWPVWREIAGIDGRNFGYDHDQSLRIHIANPTHPITRGLTDWDMVDETYTMRDADESNDILLTVDHPRSMKTIAWTRYYKKSRLFCWQSGHDNAAWLAPNFQEILTRGIQWVAKRI
jgi:type 1 glutamine amidotransferase